MNYETVLDYFDELIEDDLKIGFERLRDTGKTYHPFIGEVYDSLEEFVLRDGRRLAACSTLMTYKGYRGSIDEMIVKACSGIELYRHSILVHDDIVDREMLRRGGETLHRIFGKRDEHLGMGTSIFAGNILYSLALKAILESGFGVEEVNEAVRFLASEYQDVNESQMLDQLFEYQEISPNEWDVMASKRAASLFKASLLSGAILASAPQEEMRILKKAAWHIGFAFDIQDDIIDTFASKEQYGRDPCGDIFKGKKPLHIAIALQKSDQLAAIMQRRRVPSEEEIKEIQDIIRESGALQEAKFISRDNARKAESLISSTLMGYEEKEFFLSFIRYVDESVDWYS